MGKYEGMSRQILENIGGVDNITKVTHCITRLRIEIADSNKVDHDALAQLPESKGTIIKGQWIQVVIGPKVKDAYNEFLAFSGKTRRKNHIRSKEFRCVGQ